ncbi:MAG: hypothetical protein FWH05_07165 [Oscillospiraceae bacterium]|nr:hypothetical protein [Oscillospiraceae bacterium]
MMTGKENNEYSNFFQALRRVNPTNYFNSNPLSLVANENLGGRMTHGIFYKEFHVFSLKSLVSLGEIADLSADISKNTAIITGFRGSGKTTFAKLLVSLLDETISFPNTDMYRYKNEIDFEKTIEEIKKHNKNKGIKFSNDNAISVHVEYLKENIKGYPIHLNFETGMNSHENPFKMKLIHNLKKLIKKTIAENKHCIFNRVCITTRVNVNNLHKKKINGG